MKELFGVLVFNTQGAVCVIKPEFKVLSSHKKDLKQDKLRSW